MKSIRGHPGEEDIDPAAVVHIRLEENVLAVRGEVGVRLLAVRWANAVMPGQNTSFPVAGTKKGDVEAQGLGVSAIDAHDMPLGESLSVAEEPGRIAMLEATADDIIMVRAEGDRGLI